MNFSRWSSVYLKSSRSAFLQPLQLCRLKNERFFHERNHLYLQFANSKIGTIKADINKNHIDVRHISTTSRLNYEKNDDSIINFIAESGLVGKVQDILIRFHDFTGLSWWATIIVAAVTVRTVFILPLAIHQHYVVAKLEEVQKTLDTTIKTDVTKLVNNLSKQHNWNSKQMSIEYKRIMKERKQNEILKHNCHPAKTAVIVLVQAPIWICLSSAIRNLVFMGPVQDAFAQIINLQMQVSKFLWLSNLTTPDETWTIPISLAVVNLSILQVNYLARKQQTGFRKIILNVLRCVSLYMAYISTTIPSAISLYWLTSSCYGLCQNIILTHPTVKKVLGIPLTETARQNFFGHTYKKVKNFIKFLKY